MIDIHCHLVPGLDDGSPDQSISLERLRQADASGVSRIYLTSHYFKGHYEYSRNQYDDLVTKLKEDLSIEGSKIELRPGFEVFVQPDILDDIKDKSLFLGDSRYVLVESELNGLPPSFYSLVYPMLRSGLMPVLAHAERYVSIMHKPDEAGDLVSRNIYIQINAGSLLGFYGDKVRSTAIKLLEKGWCHFLGSDDHGRGEYSTYLKARNWIAEHIDETTANLLCKDFPSRIEEGIKIPYKYVELVHTHSSHRRKKGILQRLFG